MAIMARQLGRVDGRPIATAGAVMFAFAMWQWSQFTLQSGTDDFFWPLVVRGVALGLVFIPLNNLAVAELPMTQIGAATGLYNLMRQLGGSIGIALSANVLTRFTAEARAALVSHLPAGDAVRRIAAAIRSSSAPSPALSAVIAAWTSAKTHNLPSLWPRQSAPSFCQRSPALQPSIDRKSTRLNSSHRT